jgi:hypothetical protein
MSELVALKNQLNSSINHWLRFLGPLQNHWLRFLGPLQSQTQIHKHQDELFGFVPLLSIHSLGFGFHQTHSLNMDHRLWQRPFLLSLIHGITTDKNEQNSAGRGEAGVF